MSRARFPTLARLGAWVVLFSTTWQTTSRSGLIIEADPAINVSKISDLAIRRGNLIVRYKDGSPESEIKLPPGALERVSLWAASQAKGPMVVSIDSVFVTGGAGVYYPPYIQKDLGSALVAYDGFAADLAVGAFPSEAKMTHPLIRRSGEGLLPFRQYAALMDPENRSDSAVWYRRLAAQYLLPPGYPERGGTLAVIGEHTIRALPVAEGNGSGLPVRLEVISHRWMVPSKWYRSVNVPSEWDRWIAALPFEPLRQDMEQHWDEYREAFKPLDELSGIVETFAILGAIRRTDDTIWERFRDRLMQGDDTLEPVALAYTHGRNLLKFPTNPSSDAWISLAAGSLDPSIETSAQANLVLGFLAKGLVPERSRIYYRTKVEAHAQKDPVLRARLALADALVADPRTDFLKETTRFFDMVRGQPELFRLRAQAIHMLRDRDAKIRADLEKIDKSAAWASLKTWSTDVTGQLNEVKVILGEERARVLTDFQTEVSDRLARAYTTRGEPAIWEDLSQNVYSDDLLKLAREQGEGKIDPELLRIIAEIHYHRGMAPQVGMELAYRHAHFRFLGHLANSAQDDNELRSKIYNYRTQLAALMGLGGWEQEGERP